MIVSLVTAGLTLFYVNFHFTSESGVLTLRQHLYVAVHLYRGMKKLLVWLIACLLLNIDLGRVAEVESLAR